MNESVSQWINLSLVANYNSKILSPDSQISKSYSWSFGWMENTIQLQSLSEGIFLKHWGSGGLGGTLELTKIKYNLVLPSHLCLKEWTSEGYGSSSSDFIPKLSDSKLFNWAYSQPCQKTCFLFSWQIMHVLGLWESYLYFLVSLHNKRQILLVAHRLNNASFTNWSLTQLPNSYSNWMTRNYFPNATMNQSVSSRTVHHNALPGWKVKLVSWMLSEKQITPGCRMRWLYSWPRKTQKHP